MPRYKVYLSGHAAERTIIVMKSKALDILKFVIGWPLSLIALYFIYRLISPRLPEITNSLHTLNVPLLILGICSFLGYYVFRTILWHELIKHKRVHIPFKETMYLWSISEINRYIPGNIWSFLSRSFRFSQKNMAKKDIATSLVHETVFVLIGAVIVSLFSLDYLADFPVIKEIFNVLPPGWIMLFVLFLVICFVFQKRVVGKEKIPARFSFLSPYEPTENIRFILLSAASLAFFGFGYYFSISSVAHLLVNDFFAVSSFAVISLLVGYLSLLTPTGLGVREGILTFGLSQSIPVALAGFSALFARIVLIISELLFLALSTVWFKSKNRILQKWEHVLKNDFYKTLLVTGVVAYISYISFASFLRYDNFYTGRFDLGNMVQTVWNTSEGRLFLFTHPDSTEIISRLAFHADVILILFAPLYWLWPHADLLLFIQAFVVGCGALFLYGISLHLLKDKLTSLLIGLSFLINPSVMRSNLYDFHAVVLATTFFLAAWYYYLKKKHLLLIVFLILAGTTKEQVWAIIALFGLYMVASEMVQLLRKKMSLSHLFVSPGILRGLTIFVVSGLICYLLIWHIIPSARGGGGHFALEFYGEFGSSPSDLFLSVIFEPVKVIQTAFGGERIDYLKQIFSPVGYLPLMFPFILMFAFPDLLINLLSSNANFYQIYYQYTATITPFLFIGSVYGIWVVRRYIPSIPVFLFGLYFFAMAVHGAYQYGPLPGAKRPNLAMFDNPIENRFEVDEYLRSIPKDAKVAATNNAGSHLSDREYIFTLPIGLEEADYVVFLVDPHPHRDLEHKERILKLLNNPGYDLVKRLENFYVFRKVRYLTSDL